MALLVRVSYLRKASQISRDTDIEYLRQDLVEVMAFVLRAGNDKAGAEDISLSAGLPEALFHLDRCRVWIDLLLETKAISKYIHLSLSRMADHIYEQLLVASTHGDSSLRSE